MSIFKKNISLGTIQDNCENIVLSSVLHLNRHARHPNQPVININRLSQQQLDTVTFRKMTAIIFDSLGLNADNIRIIPLGRSCASGNSISLLIDVFLPVEDCVIRVEFQDATLPLATWYNMETVKLGLKPKKLF